MGFDFRIAATDFNLEALSTSCDFEKALMKAVKAQFSCRVQTQVPHHIGCLFHWKQALRRHLEGLDIPKVIIKSLMDKKGLINILPVIPAAEIMTHGN